MAHEGLHESEEKLYNNLFRRYPEGSDMLQIDYLKGLCTIALRTIALRIDAPKAICTIRPKATGPRGSRRRYPMAKFDYVIVEGGLAGASAIQGTFADLERFSGKPA